MNRFDEALIETQSEISEMEGGEMDEIGLGVDESLIMAPMAESEVETEKGGFVKAQARTERSNRPNLVLGFKGQVKKEKKEKRKKKKKKKNKAQLLCCFRARPKRWLECPNWI
jgi:hypothetical protein